MALQANNIADLLNTLFENVERLRFTDISSPLQRYIGMKRLIKKHKTIFDGGTSFKFDLMTNDDGSARWVGLRAPDMVNSVDVMARGEINYKHMTWNWSVDHREIAMNEGAFKVVSLALVRRLAAFISAVKDIEKRLWRAPAIADDVHPSGIPTYVVKAATEGFTTNVPAGYTTVAGLDPTLPSLQNPDGTTKWGNWAFQYASVTQEDFMRKTIKALNYTDFDTPAPNMPTFDTGDDMGLFTNYSLYSRLNEFLRKQNDDLGPELAAYEGKGVIMNNIYEWVPQLDEDTTDPMYGIQWGEFGTAGLRKLWLRETIEPVLAGYHTVAVNFTDLSLNFFTRNRRRHFVGALGTTMPA